MKVFRLKHAFAIEGESQIYLGVGVKKGRFCELDNATYKLGQDELPIELDEMVSQVISDEIKGVVVYHSYVYLIYERDNTDLDENAIIKLEGRIHTL